MLLASVTSFDQTSNCHLRKPSTPQCTLPLWIPTDHCGLTTLTTTTDHCGYLLTTVDWPHWPLWIPTDHYHWPLWIPTDHCGLTTLTTVDTHSHVKYFHTSDVTHQSASIQQAPINKLSTNLRAATLRLRDTDTRVKRIIVQTATHYCVELMSNLYAKKIRGGQRSTSNVTKIKSLLGFIVTHFTSISEWYLFQFFLLRRQTHRQTKPVRDYRVRIQIRTPDPD